MANCLKAALITSFWVVFWNSIKHFDFHNTQQCTHLKQQSKTYQDRLIKKEENIYFLLKRSGPVGSCRPQATTQWGAFLSLRFPFPSVTSSCYCAPTMPMPVANSSLCNHLFLKINLNSSLCCPREWNRLYFVLYYSSARPKHISSTILKCSFHVWCLVTKSIQHIA